MLDTWIFSFSHNALKGVFWGKLEQNALRR